MVFWAVLVALPLMTSVVYFRASPPATPLPRRVAASAHGFFIALLHLGALYIAAAQLHGDQYGTPFFVLCLVAAALIGYSFWAFGGKKQVHWLQAINISWLFGLLFLGGMAVTGRWL
jgi:4-hydroxybenzoate polyprenyltransferase